MNLPRAFALYLASESLVSYSETVPGGNCFLGSMPDQPDIAVMLHPTGGFTSSTKAGYDERTIQVMVRGTRNPVVGNDLAEAIYDALHGLRGMTLPDGTYLVRCEGIQTGPISLGEDAKGRHEYTLNFLAQVRNPRTNAIE